MSSLRSAATPRSAPWPAVAFVVVLVQLLALNGYMWWRNQRTFVLEDRPRLVPRNIALVTALNNYNPVKYMFNMYYELRHLDGATLVIPQLLGAHQFFLEEVSRLHVEIVPDVPLLSNDFLDRLRYDHRVKKTLHLDPTTWIDVVIVPRTRKYVLTRTVDGRFFVILPEQAYQEDRASRTAG
jgi:hypothetical protein